MTYYTFFKFPPPCHSENGKIITILYKTAILSNVNIVGYHFNFESNVFYASLSNFKDDIFSPGNYQICYFLVLCLYYFLLQKSCFTDKYYLTIFKIAIFLVIKVLNYFFCRICVNYDKPCNKGHFFQKAWHVLDDWFEALKTWCSKIKNNWKFEQAFQNMLTVLFLIFFSLITGFPKSLDRTTVSVSEVKSNKAHS